MGNLCFSPLCKKPCMIKCSEQWKKETFKVKGNRDVYYRDQISNTLANKIINENCSFIKRPPENCRLFFNILILTSYDDHY